MRIGMRSVLAATLAAAAIVSTSAATATAASTPTPQHNATSVFAKRGQTTKFAATVTFNINLPKGDHAVLTAPGVRFIDAKGQAVGGMTRLDVADTSGHIHHTTWTLKGDQLTQTISGVNGSTIEGVVVRPTTPGQMTANFDWDCFGDGVTALTDGVITAGTVAAAPESGGATLAATGAVAQGAWAAAQGVKDNCF
jgi:hypothetical protein